MGSPSSLLLKDDGPRLDLLGYLIDGGCYWNETQENYVALHVYIRYDVRTNHIRRLFSSSLVAVDVGRDRKSVV